MIHSSTQGRLQDGLNLQLENVHCMRSQIARNNVNDLAPRTVHAAGTYTLEN